MIAANGFADTTGKAIAAKAGADVASINYHFGNRSGLYQAVLIESHQRIIDRADVERLATAPLSARGKLKMLIEFVLAGGSGQDRWPIVVLSRELVAPSTHIEALRDVEGLPKLLLVLPILSEISGIPIDEQELWLCLPCVGAPCLALLLAGHSQPFGDLFRPLPNDTTAEHLYTFAVAGLEAVGGRWARRSQQT